MLDRLRDNPGADVPVPGPFRMLAKASLSPEGVPPGEGSLNS
jgi:hypothetical protein